jgi:hypothetical protein
MDPIDWVEWLGYFASVVVLVSLTMASIVKLRWINLVGAGLYTLYGALIHSLPIVVLNLGIVFINLYYLYKYYASKERFDLVMAEIDSELFEYFLRTHREEIEKIVPIPLLKQCQKALYMLRNDEIAGILVGDRYGDILDIKLDYVIPKYRDFKLGEYFFVKRVACFRERGIRKVFAHAKEESHQAYLRRMGFEPVDEKRTTWEKTFS